MTNNKRNNQLIKINLLYVQKVRDMEDIKKTLIKFLEIKSTMCEMKSTLDGINSSLENTRKNISELEGVVSESIQNETQSKKNPKKW